MRTPDMFGRKVGERLPWRLHRDSLMLTPGSAFVKNTTYADSANGSSPTLSPTHRPQSTQSGSTVVADSGGDTPENRLQLREFLADTVTTPGETPRSGTILLHAPIQMGAGLLADHRPTTLKEPPDEIRHSPVS